MYKRKTFDYVDRSRSKSINKNSQNIYNLNKESNRRSFQPTKNIKT